jgi:hypothetical protein
MKKILYLIFALSAVIANTQVPQGIPYQAVARNSSGAILANQGIRVRFSIHDSIAAGTLIYTETFTPTTTAQGLFNVNIGTGTSITGTFSAINWGHNAKYMQVEMDPTGGTSYVDMGTQQMMSVPYALYAGSSSNSTGWSIGGNTGIISATNFIGTTDNNALRFRVNNQWSGELNPSTSNTSLGLNAMPATIGYQNTAIGTQSLYSNTSGFSNSAYGYQSLYSDTSGHSNTANGTQSLYFNRSGVMNTASGYQSLYFNTTGNSNTASGTFSLYSNTTGSNNTGIGTSSLNANTTGNDNTSIGASSLNQSATGNANTAIGVASLHYNTTGSNNTATGTSSLTSNTTGYSNTANGYHSLFSNTTGISNTAVGFNSLSANTTANDNTAIGYQSLVQNTTGGRNTGVGEGSLNSNTTGDNNIGIGSAAIGSNTTGRYNTGVGVQALLSNVTGTNITAIGFGSDVIGTALNNASALGTLSTVNANNKVVIGNASIGTIGGFANWSNLSDGRFKTNVQENVPGLDFILKLRPVTYNFQARKFEKFLGRPDSLIQNLSESYVLAESQMRTGFVAQEVEMSAQQLGYDFSGIHKPTNDKDNYSLAYAEFTVPLVKAVQEQQKIIGDQQKTIRDLQKQLEEVMKRIQDIENRK